MAETKRIKAPIHIPTLLACSIFASKDEERYYLQGVYVEVRPGGVLYCATDHVAGSTARSTKAVSWHPKRRAA